MSRHPIVRLYREADRTAVDELYARVFGPSLAAHFRRRWQWEFDGVPGTRAAGNLVAERDGRIIAHLGRLPARVSIAGHVVQGAFLTDLMADPTGSGLASLRLIDEALKDLPVAMLLGGKPNTQQLYARVGMRPLPIGQMLVRIERPAGAMAAAAHRIARRRLPGRERYVGRWLFALPGVAARPFLAVLQRRSAARPRAAFRIERLLAFDARFDLLWQGMHERCPVACVHDRAFLQWRYGDALTGDYVTLGAFDERGHLAAAAVLAEVTTGPSSYGKFMECLYSSTAALDALLDASLEHLRRSGVDLTVAAGLSVEARAALRERGFRPTGRSRGFALTANVSAEHEELLRRPENWYVSPGDGDEDFAETVTAEPPQRQPKTAWQIVFRKRTAWR